MYGSVSLRKYTGPNHGCPRRALRNAGSLRAILAGIDAVHAQARNRDLLASFGIELGDVRHFRRLPQQLEELDAAQFHVVRVELGQCGVRERILNHDRDLELIPQAGQRRKRQA